MSRYSALAATIGVTVGCLCLPAVSGAKAFPVQSTLVSPISPGGHPQLAAPAHVTIPFRPLDPAALQAGQQRAHQQYLSSRQPSGPAAPQSSLGPQISLFQGLSWSGLSAIPAGDETPPDGGAGIGPNAFIEAINSEIAVYNRTTTASIASSSLATFTGGTDPCDPSVMWDNGAQRWVVIAIECTSSSSHTMYLDFTKSADPAELSSGWCKYSIDSGSEFADYPKAGHNNSDWLVGTNDFSTSSGNFDTAQLWALEKPANGAITTCPPLHVDKTSTTTQLTTVDSNQIFTPNASDQLDSRAPTPGTRSDTGYFVAYEQPGTRDASEINVIDFTRDASGTAQFTPAGDIAVAPYAFPGGVPQPGALSGDVLDSLDTRGLGASSHVDPTRCSGCEAVWLEHAIDGPGGRSQIQWDELDPAACTGAALCGSGAVLQDGRLSSPSLFYWNPRISPDGFGNEAVMNFNAGSATQLPAIMAASNTPADSAGATGTPIVIQTSSHPDDDRSCPSQTGNTDFCRWGDYAAAEADPLNAGVVWNNSMYTATAVNTNHDAQWGTQNFAIRPAGPASRVTVTLTPSSVPADGTAQTVAEAAVSDAEGNPVQGDAISFASTDTGNRIGPMTDHHDGTYTATITSSVTVGSPTITATDTSAAPAVSGQATLTQTPGPATTVRISLAPPSIVANGTSQSTATATIADARGRPVAGDEVSFASSDSGNRIGPVTDHHDGTYTVTVTSSATVGSPTITATDTSVAPAVSGQATLTQTPGPATTVRLSLSPSSIVADGTSQSAAIATITDAQAHPIAGEDVTFASSDSANRIGPVSDHHDGTYAATITSSATVGSPTITATDTSVSPPLPGHAALTQRAPKPVITNLTESHHTFAVGHAPAKQVSAGPSSRRLVRLTASILEPLRLLASELATFAGRPAQRPVATPAKKRRPPVGTVFSFTLNTNARVQLAFTRRPPRRKVGGACVAQSKHYLHRVGCRRTVSLGSVSLSAYAGPNLVSFSGVLSRTTKLAPGAYTMTLTARNSAGRSNPRTISFSLVK